MGLFDKLFKPRSPSKDKFAQQVMDGIRRAGETAKLVYDEKQFTVRGEGPRIVNLGNAYAEYCAAAREQRPDVLQRWVRGWFAFAKEMPEEYEDARHNLLPTLRSRSYFDVTRLRMDLDGGKGTWPYQTIGEHFAAGLVYDMHVGMRSICQEDLDNWGVTFYEAMEVALENLQQRPTSFIGPQEGEGVYLSVNGDNHDCARLLLLDVIRKLRVKGEPIAFVPNRDTLIVTGSEDMGGLKGMLALAKDALEKQHHQVSTIALRFAGDEWETWLPPAGHPLYNNFKLLQVTMLVEGYRAQKEALDKLHEKRGEDVFVATYNGVQKKDTGEPRSYAVWSGGIVSWLPQPDVVVFLRSQTDTPRLYNWQQVVQVAGDLVKPLDMYPPRFEVSDFPTDEQFAAMGEQCSL